MKEIYEKVLKKHFGLNTIKELHDLEKGIWEDAGNISYIKQIDEIQADDIDSVIKLTYKETAKEIFADLEFNCPISERCLCGECFYNKFQKKQSIYEKLKKKYLGKKASE